ncbi:MAG: NifU N-terminal domain-containing protein [Acidimicrobiales bacterium]|nr:NifU N-terminal domain-containing protein [Acidimicrobiales bacterium]
MGQPVSVVEKMSATPGVVRFEANRSLTGMGHERYRSREDATGTRPPDELARRLFDTGQVAAVHVYSNMVTIDLAKGATADGLREVVEDLFLYYREGVTPATP